MLDNWRTDFAGIEACWYDWASHPRIPPAPTGRADESGNEKGIEDGLAEQRAEQRAHTATVAIRWEVVNGREFQPGHRALINPSVDSVIPPLERIEREHAVDVGQVEDRPGANAGEAGDLAWAAITREGRTRDPVVRVTAFVVGTVRTGARVRALAILIGARCRRNSPANQRAAADLNSQAKTDNNSEHLRTIPRQQGNSF